VAVDPAAPADGQVLTFDASSSAYKPKPAGSGNATSLQGVPVDTASPSDGQVVTYEAASGKYKPKPGGNGLSAAMQPVKYSADFAFTASASTDLSTAGAKTVSLASCPSGVKGSEKYYYVYLAGSGTPDSAEANGLNIALDKQLVADIKALIAAIEAYAKTAGMAKPAAR